MPAGAEVKQPQSMHREHEKETGAAPFRYRWHRLFVRPPSRTILPAPPFSPKQNTQDGGTLDVDAMRRDFEAVTQRVRVAPPVPNPNPPTSLTLSLQRVIGFTSVRPSRADGRS